MAQAQIWPGWDTVRTIGSGSCGTVYEIRKADDPTGTYRAALKVICVPADQNALQHYARQGLSPSDMRDVFYRQAQEALAALSPIGQLNGCPHIVCCEEQMLVPQEDGIGWYILLRMPLLTPISDYFARHGTHVKNILRLGTEICTALERSAAYGIFHGNIKPQNILVSTGDEFMLADFGMAAMMQKLGVSPNADSYSYMSPEVYRGTPAQEASDVYSLGFVLYWLLNDCHVPFLPEGVDPRDPRALAQAHHTRFSARRLPAPVHGRQNVKSAVLKACELDIASRFANAGALGAALQSCMDNSASPVSAPAAACAPTAAAPSTPYPPEAYAPVPSHSPEPHAAAYAAAPYPGYSEDLSTLSYYAAPAAPPKKKRSVGLILLLVFLLALIIGCGVFLTIHILDSMDSASESASGTSSESRRNRIRSEDSEEEVVEETEDPGEVASEEEETEEEIEEEEVVVVEKETEEETEVVEKETVSRPANAVAYNGHYYYIYNCAHAGNWLDAKAFCEAQGGHLATISSRDEDLYLYNYMVRSGFENAYFGYSDVASEGNWAWANAERSSYTNWYPGEPNNYASSEHYAMYYLGYHDGTWNDDNGLMFDLDNAPFVMAKSMSSSSYLTEGATTYDAVSAIDGTPKTTWSEGASGQGIGETLTMDLAQTYNLVGFTIHAGYQFSPDFYNANSRPRVIELTFSDGTVEEVELADLYGQQTIYFSHPVTATSVTLKIKSVYPGDKFEDTCISEIVFLSGVLNTGFICEWDE